MKVISVDFSEQVFLCKDGTPTKTAHMIQNCIIIVIR